MTQNWEPGTQYNIGDKVRYEGKEYKIIQPHRSQGDWCPDRTPALWGLIPGGHCGGRPELHNEDGDYSQPKPHHSQPPNYEQKPWNEHSEQHVPIHEEEKQKKWYDLDDKRKKELEIGGGLALGAALLAGGFAAYKHHEKGEEEKKAHAWGAQNYVQDAQTRTQRFHQQGPQNPGACTWVLVHGQEIPQGALVCGDTDGEPLYACRSYHEGGIQVGKAGRQCNKGGVIGWSHEEVEVDTYEVLLGNSDAVRWVDVEGKLKVSELGARPVEAGKEEDGTPLYVAQGPYNNGTHCGKVSEKLSCAFIPADGKERELRHYRVLCYA